MIRLFRHKPREASIVNVLPRLLKRKQLLKLSREVSDPRSLLDIAIDLFPDLKNKILTGVSNLTGYPLWLEDLYGESWALDQLPVNKLQRLGAYPLFSETGLLGIAAVDPFIAKKALKAPGDFKFFLTSYSLIEKAWDRYSQEKIKEEYLIKEKVGFLNNLFDKITASFLEENLQKAKVYFSNDEIHIESEGRSKVVISNVINEDYQFVLDSFVDEKIISLRSLGEATCYIDKNQLIINRLDNTGSCLKDSAFKDKNIIVVDDSNVFIKALEKLLAHCQVSIVSFNNPAAAIKYVNDSRKKIDLIICDLHMPDIDGDKFKQQISQRLEEERIPFVILSSDNDVESQLKLYKSGVDDFLSKGDDSRLIVSKIKAILTARMA